MRQSKYRNQPCPCHSGKKYKHCCLTEYYESLISLVTPIQKKVMRKESEYWKKRYNTVTSEDTSNESS